MAELSNPTGIGQDGYLRIQKETTYGTAVTSSMTLLPIKPGSLLKGYPELIENSNLIASRLKQAPNQGRLIRSGSFQMDCWPTLMGLIFEWHLGASSDNDEGDGAYTHYWLCPISGVNTGVSHTVQQAVGSSVADQFDGVKSDNLTLTQDSQTNAQMSMDVVAQGLTEGVSRISSFSYPSNSSNPPFNFGHASITLTVGSDTVLTCANNIEVGLPLNHDTERFKICSSASAEIKEPVFNGIPGATVSVNVHADRYFMTYARSYQQFDLTITWTHTTSEAGSTPTYHSMVLEFPGVRLSPDTEIPTTEDRTQMDLTFECGYGGTSTNSGSDTVQYEVRVVDATAAYAG